MAEDPDVSFNAEVRYSIATADGPFTVNPDTGTVSTAITLYTQAHNIVEKDTVISTDLLYYPSLCVCVCVFRCADDHGHIGP